MTGTTYWISTTLMDTPPPSLILHDAGEGHRIEARTTHERPIDVRLGHERIDVLGLHAAPVEDPDAVGRRARGAGADLAADGVMDLLRLCGCRGPAGADRPHRLVGDDAGGDLLGADVGEGGVDLTGDDGAGRLGLALLERLADAHDRDEAGGQHGAGPPVDGLVGIAEELPALGVTDDHEDAARLAEHRDRDLARVGALWLPVAVLRGELDPRSIEGPRHHVEGREGWRDHHLPPARAADVLGQRLGERDRLAARAVHLPVAGDQRGAAHRAFSIGSVGSCSSARRPGSSRPSRNSSDAPPPVDTWVTAATFPARRSAATESPPPTTVVPLQAAIASATASVPRLNGSISKMPIGPFQKTVPAGSISSRKACAVAGPMSTPRRFSGKASAATTRDGGSACGRSAARWSVGRSTRTPRSSASRSVSRARPTLSSSTRER